MANLITSCRIFFSLLLLFFPALSPGFCGLYISAGLGDMLDGFVARRTNSTSPPGCKAGQYRGYHISGGLPD